MNRVLVIVPTLSRPQLCARALDSLVAQNFGSWDCVIAKNGGSERLGQYVAELGPRLNDNRIRMLVLPKRGLGYALNEAIAHFGADHRAFANLEDDDEWDPDFLRIMYRELNRTGADIVHCYQRQEPRARQSNGGPMSTSEIRVHNWVNWPECLCRVKLWHTVGGVCQEAGPATDWDWHLRCLQAGAKYHFVPETLVTHHWHESNYCIQNRDDGKQFVLQRVQEGFYD